MRVLAILSLGVCLSGCGADDRIEPVSGTWNYRDGGIVRNTCGSDDLYTDPNLTFALQNNGDGTFTVDQGNEEDFDCNIDGELFECPYRLGGEQMNADLSVTIAWRARVDGSFSSSTQMSGTQTAELTCEGANCALAPTIGLTFPCEYEVAFDADKD